MSWKRSMFPLSAAKWVLVEIIVQPVLTHPSIWRHAPFIQVLILPQQSRHLKGLAFIRWLQFKDNKPQILMYIPSPYWRLPGYGVFRRSSAWASWPWNDAKGCPDGRWRRRQESRAQITWTLISGGCKFPRDCVLGLLEGSSKGNRPLYIDRK